MKQVGLVRIRDCRSLVSSSVGISIYSHPPKGSPYCPSHYSLRSNGLPEVFNFLYSLTLLPFKNWIYGLDLSSNGYCFELFFMPTSVLSLQIFGAHASESENYWNISLEFIGETSRLICNHIRLINRYSLESSPSWAANCIFGIVSKSCSRSPICFWSYW